ncbi:kinase-like domain-containing protein, partial [Rhizophagus irregularis DAOM 181602=DAOM 197198]
MVLQYCKDGSLRDYIYQSEKHINYFLKIDHLFQISRGLLYIHKSGKIHRDLHSGNILFDNIPYISDFGLCQSATNNKKQEVYGVTPYIAPEVLREYKYTKATDIYSFGILMNEYISQEFPYNDIPHDHILTVNICSKGLRPKISENTPKLFADLITKCWDTKAENRPTVKEL